MLRAVFGLGCLLVRLLVREIEKGVDASSPETRLRYKLGEEQAGVQSREMTGRPEEQFCRAGRGFVGMRVLRWSRGDLTTLALALWRWH